MSLVKISGNASGTGTLTIAAPNTNTNYTLTLPTQTGTLITTAGGQAVAGTTGAFTTTVGVGAATPAASGAGITFPATASASSDANTLDDYEEGSWTPSIAFGGGSTGITYDAGNRSGSYTKIGRLVFITCVVGLTNKGSSTGAAWLDNLPFIVASANENYSALSFSYFDTMTFADFVMMRVVASSNYAILTQTTNAGVNSGITSSNFSNSTFLRISGCYQATS
jgi:hypothetical protein